MAQTIQLTPLLCPGCRTALPARADEIVWRCPGCGRGWQLAADDPRDELGLAPLAIQFSARLDARAVGRPFWVADGRVAVRRDTYGGNQQREAEAFWAQPRRFCVPAFACPLTDLVALGMEAFHRPPELTPGPATAFAPVTLPRSDVADLAEFIVVGLEAGRRDQLKSLQFAVQLAEPALWILP